MSLGYEFYSRPEYFRELSKRIASLKSGDRIALASMSLNTTLPEVREIITGLAAAANRGTKVILLIDAYSFLANDKSAPGPMFFYGSKLPRRIPKSFQDKLELLAKLKARGGSYRILNVPKRSFTNPLAGRSHLKFAIINDRVYLGGCNLSGAEHLDMMVSFVDKDASDWLYMFADKLLKSGYTRDALANKDIRYVLGSKAELLIDCGKPRQSMIYKKAMGLVDSARESVFIACQFFPNGITLEHLMAAHKRGVEVSVVYNHPSKHPKIMAPLHHAILTRERIRSPSKLFSQQLHRDLPYLHAKLIATEQGAIMGSHNFVPAGVKFGTAEIALLVKEPAFATSSLGTLKAQYESLL